MVPGRVAHEAGTDHALQARQWGGPLGEIAVENMERAPHWFISEVVPRRQGLQTFCTEDSYVPIARRYVPPIQSFMRIDVTIRYRS